MFFGLAVLRFVVVVEVVLLADFLLQLVRQPLQVLNRLRCLAHSLLMVG